MSLRAKSAAGVAWGFAASVTQAALQLGQMAVLARLLTKADFGLMALVSVVPSFVRGWLDLGLGNAIVQRRNLTREQLGTFFWLGTGAGLFFFLAALAAAPLLASFYGEPELAGLVMPVAATFLLFPIGNQFQLLMQREMRFRAIALAEILGKVTGAASAILLASRGHGPWALAYSVTLSETVRVGVLVGAGFGRHRPALVFSRGVLREFRSFGLFQLADRVVNSLIMELDVIVLGRLAGKEAVGVYSYAKQLVMAPGLLVIPPVSRVAFPALAQVQADPARFREVFLGGMRALCLVLFPMYALLVVLADEIVLLCFGHAWGAVLLLVQVLSIHAALRAALNTTGLLALAQGRARLLVGWNAGVLGLSALTVLSAGSYAPLTIAWALVAAYAALFWPGWLILVRPVCGASLRMYFGVYAGPVLLAVLTLGTAWGAQFVFHGHIQRLVGAGLAGGAVWAAGNLWANRGLIAHLWGIRGRREPTP